jgi:uncharacterized repeat protein (TIGR02543 family)
MDGAVFSLTGATSGAYAGGFTRVNIDVSSYADGNSHALEFEQINAASSGPTNIFLDDVALTVLPSNVTVSFDSNGGTAVSSQVVPNNSTASTPTPPTKTGNTFAGWYSDAGLTSAFSFATPITADITLYAGWQPGTIDIDADGNYDADRWAADRPLSVRAERRTVDRRRARQQRDAHWAGPP